MKFLVSFLFLFFTSFCFSQEADSLLSTIGQERSPAKKAKIYLKLVALTAQSDSVKAKQFLKQAESLASSRDNILQAEIQNSWGFYYMANDPERAKKHHLKGIAILEGEQSAEAQDLRAKLWYNVGADFQRMGRPKEALDMLLNRGIPEAKKAADKIYLANNYLTVGLIFYNDNNLDKAIQYHQMAVKTAQQMKPSPKKEDLLITAQLGITEAYLKKEDYPTARKTLDVLTGSSQKKLSARQLPELLHLESIYYLKTGNYQKSLENAEAGMKITEKTGDLYQMTRLIFMKSKAQSNLGKFDDAAATLKDLLNNETYVTVYGGNLATIYDELWMLEERRGNYKDALSYATKRIAITDSLNESGQNEMINEMETQFRTAEKEKELVVKQLEINKKNQYIWTFVITTLVFLGAGFFTFFYFRNKRRLSVQREINLQQKLKEKENEEELKVTKAILDGEECERERVAKDLHDGLGGMLAGVKINMSTWSNHHLEENQVESFHAILNQLDSSVSELRRVARNLMPESLLNFGLEIALKDLCEFYMKDNLQIDFQAINIQNNMPVNLQANIYRIVQELLNNAVKHSGANNILVQCSQEGSNFFITVDDNGKGIRKDEMSKVKSLGLKNLQNRVDFMKGKMEIETAQNQGTSINIELKTNVA